MYKEEKLDKKKYKDTVCRKWLAKETKNKVEKDGKVYYFCSPACKEKFEKEPDKYLKLVG
jgi:YHS domain-containing protein